ncbi:hypothetical protein BDB00DRAFT_873213 [Zychaea mexicana]|uniref:uncharacterized protein n=1 Tax=Zychaea mexicana TaxID=64656 RepID=UPI0022FF305D|nr:uncharacterized protein BDB00DRAFT_873213 [Zychaea mexicana]KAI9492636.1 hypothetical protein BDB00DRAFT_873213 [Zychaea mexicana]
MAQADIVLHWYPMSPFAQKLAWVLNYKNIDYKVVQISPVEPRPLRRPLDGGYRKTPILQIGNHVYCDTKRIIDELEKRYPQPSIYPKLKSGESTTALAKSIAVWLESMLFGAVSQQFDVALLPEKFKKDRDGFLGRKFGGGSPYLKLDLLAQLAQAEELLGDKPYVLDTPSLSLVDLSLAKNTFFLSNVCGPDFVEGKAPKLARHMQRIFAEAKMSRTEEMPKVKAEQALEIAQNQYQPFDGQEQSILTELKVGQDVVVLPLDTGKVPSTGILRSLTQDEIVIEHKTEKITALIHFPSVGFIATPAPKSNL